MSGLSRSHQGNDSINKFKKSVQSDNSALLSVSIFNDEEEYNSESNYDFIQIDMENVPNALVRFLRLY